MALKPGKRLEVPDRVKKNERRFTPAGRKLRTAINQLGSNVPVKSANENIEPGTGVAAVATAITYAIEDYLPVRLGADVSVANVDVVEDGVVDYTIDVNAALENQAKLKAKIDAGTGFTSLWSDTFTVLESKTLHKRVARDTYRYVIRVEV